MAEPIKVIIDVDTGVDDAMALALAVRSPALDIVAVTTVAGNVRLEYTTENTRRVLAYLGAGDVPIYRGLSRPLSRPLHDASSVHGNSGLGTFVLPEVPGGVGYPSAPQFLVDTIMGAPGEYTLIFTGPLTNLASAIALEPALPGAFKQLIIMGGALGRGNVTPYAEFNIFCDPEAAAQVFAACPLTMVGLDVTHQTYLTRANRDSLANNTSNEGRLVYGVTEEGFDGREWERAHLHDPLAVGVAIDPTFCTMQRGTVEVETATAWRAGQTVMRESADGPHQVCVGVDAKRFVAFFADTLGLPRF